MTPAADKDRIRECQIVDRCASPKGERTAVEEAHQTKPYAASAFSAAPYVPPPRTLQEITAEHPSQRDKPPPERTREMAPTLRVM